MILSLINHLVEKNSDLTPKKIAVEVYAYKGDYKGATIFGEDCRNNQDWCEVDNPRQFEYLCYGVVDYENVHNKHYDRYN